MTCFGANFVLFFPQMMLESFGPGVKMTEMSAFFRIRRSCGESPGTKGRTIGSPGVLVTLFAPACGFGPTQSPGSPEVSRDPGRLRRVPGSNEQSQGP